MKHNNFLHIASSISLCIAISAGAHAQTPSSNVNWRGSVKVTKTEQERVPLSQEVDTPVVPSYGATEADAEAQLQDYTTIIPDENEGRATVGTSAHSTPESAKAVTSTEQTPDGNTAINGEWTVYTVAGEKVTGDTRPYLNFDVKTLRLYANNGCNVINADLKFNGKDGLRFINSASTMMFCPDAPYEYKINVALENTRYYRVSNYGNEDYIYLMNERRQVTLTARRHNMNFLNGIWGVKRINGNELSTTGQNRPTLTVDTDNLHVHGNTGCNIMNGSVFIDPDKANSVQFVQLATTRRACPDMSVEGDFLVALEEVESAFAISDSVVKMVDNHGAEVLLLQKVAH